MLNQPATLRIPLTKPLAPTYPNQYQTFGAASLVQEKGRLSLPDRSYVRVSEATEKRRIYSRVSIPFGRWDAICDKKVRKGLGDIAQLIWTKLTFVEHLDLKTPWIFSKVTNSYPFILTCALYYIASNKLTSPKNLAIRMSINVQVEIQFYWRQGIGTKPWLGAGNLNALALNTIRERWA